MFKLQRRCEGKSARLKPPKIKALVLSSILTVFLCPKILSQNNPNAPSQSDESSPRIVITKVKVLGTYRQVRTDADVRTVIEYPKSVKVSWKDTFLIVGFEIQGSSDPGKNEYAYRIMGRDENWIQIGNKNSVVMENLKPGKHVLSVKGANSERMWDKEGTVLNIHVVPPWWKTPLFKMALLIAISSVFFVLYRQGRKRYRSGLQDEIDTGRMVSEFLLTHRETEIIELVLKGKSIKDISRGLSISESTVQKHIYSVYKKMKIRNRMQLINFARRYRLK